MPWNGDSALSLQVRADLNVPLDKDLNITDDTRIRAAIPTLKYLTENGAKVLLTSHLVSSAIPKYHNLIVCHLEAIRCFSLRQLLGKFSI